MGLPVVISVRTPPKPKQKGANVSDSCYIGSIWQQPGGSQGIYVNASGKLRARPANNLRPEAGEFPIQARD